MSTEFFTRAELAIRYDAIAPRWHRTLLCMGYLRSYRHLFASLTASSTLPPGGCAIDCGIGTAGFSIALLQATAGPWHINGFDISTAMLHEAEMNLDKMRRSIAGHAKLTGVHLQLADVCALPHQDASADVVICAHMLEHLPDPVAGLREMWRVLNPDAVLVLLATRQGLWGRCLRHRWRVNCADMSLLCAWLTAAGFAGVRTIPVRGSFNPCAWSSLAIVGVKRHRQGSPNSCTFVSRRP